MSAYLCHPHHVGALASYLYGKHEYRGTGYLRRYLGNDQVEESELPSLLAATLGRENWESVTFRYPTAPENELPGPVGIESRLDYLALCSQAGRRRLPGLDTDSGEADPVRILKGAACLEYQSCEHPGWEESKGRAILEAVRREAIRSLPGWEDAPWDLEA